jgi:bifunctional non-homologous end joining protein LigD
VSKALREYAAKRDFSRTAEPAGDQPADGGEPLFIVQKHAARRLHFDFRLAIDGVLKSWAVPKGPSEDPTHQRLAIQTEDHPLAYADFEGTIPEGEYGAGTVQLWDRGRWTIEGGPREALRKGHLRLTLEGEKLRGVFDLIRFKGEDAKQWFLRKRAEGPAGTARNPLSEELDYSVKTGRTLSEIARGLPSRRRVAPPGGRGSARRDGAEGLSPDSFTPQLATLVDRVPTGAGWCYEVKWDGYRVLAHRHADEVRLFTRQGRDWTERFGPLVPALESLDGAPWVLDGEVVVLDEEGRSDFGALQHALKAKVPPGLHYVVFDLLAHEGEDLRPRPLRERKERLRAWFEECGPPHPLRYSDHFRGGGGRLFRSACENALEGLIAKRLDAPYRGGRQRSWEKVKCHQRQEFAIVGFTAPRGGREALGALLLASRENGQWRYRGKVGTGFNDTRLRDLARRLREHLRPRPPKLSPRPDERAVTWVEPVLGAEIRYAELTGEGLVRHAVFEGLREDKPTASMALETPRRAPPSAKAMKPPSTPSATSPRGVTISHPDRVIDPASGATKGELAAYYAAIAPHALPYFRHRPLSLVRCPQGRQKKCFFQKHFTDAPPPHTHTVEVPEKSGTGRYSHVTTAAGLVALAQYGTIEFHGWGSLADRPEVPDQLVFDLDPDESVRWEAILGAAFLLRDLLGELGLKSFPKATGGNGLHVCVPLLRRASWEEAKPFARAVAEALVRRNPKALLAKASKAARKGRIFVDYLRNGRGATAVMPYSARARPGLTVALPLSWDDLPEQRPSWTIAEVPDLLAAREDPWTEYRSTRQALTRKRLQAVGG